MKKLVILLILSLSSCGYSLAIQGPTTTTTTSTTIPQTTTTTTLDFGHDCHLGINKEMTELATAIRDAQDVRKGSVPTTKQWQKETKAWRDFRSFIRLLDIPLLTVEQAAYVNAIEDYLIAFNRYMESNKTDLTLNNYLTSLSDAHQDFSKAWSDLCKRRIKGA